MEENKGEEKGRVMRPYEKYRAGNYKIQLVRLQINDKGEARVLNKNAHFKKSFLEKEGWEENEHADVLITTPEGEDILCRQIAGAMARRIVTYAKPGEECYIDEHLGFIKLGARVDVFLPIGSEVCVKMGPSTTGDLTVLAKLPP